MSITQQQLADLFTYNPETGEFARKASMGKARAGVVAGSIHHTGYRRIKVMFREYKAHRLAWLYAYGAWPNGQIDHINGVRDDNRIANLRDVGGTENQHNRRGPSANNRAGYLGVSLCSKSGRYRATIKLDGKNKRLGLYDTAEQAHEAYCAAKARLHPTSPMYMIKAQGIAGPSANV